MKHLDEEMLNTFKDVYPNDSKSYQKSIKDAQRAYFLFRRLGGTVFSEGHDDFCFEI